MSREPGEVQFFTASIYFHVSYHDPRLADPAGLTVRTFDLNEIWWPDLGLMNRRNLQLLFPDELKVDRAGNVVYTQRVYGDFSARLDLRRFPFDSQRIPVEVVSYSLGPEDLDLVKDEEHTGRFDSMSLTGWTLLSGEVDALPKRDGALHLEQLVFYVDVARKATFYRWSISCLPPPCWFSWPWDRQAVDCISVWIGQPYTAHRESPRPTLLKRQARKYYEWDLH